MSTCVQHLPAARRSTPTLPAPVSSTVPVVGPAYAFTVTLWKRPDPLIAAITRFSSATLPTMVISNVVRPAFGTPSSEKAILPLPRNGSRTAESRGSYGASVTASIRWNELIQAGMAACPTTPGAPTGSIHSVEIP